MIQNIKVFDKEIEEDPNAYRQIVAFVGDFGFFEVLLEELEQMEIIHVINMDTDLRLPPKEPKSYLLPFTIFLEEKDL